MPELRVLGHPVACCLPWLLQVALDGGVAVSAERSTPSVPHRECFAPWVSDNEVLSDVQLYGCPEDICPACYLAKPHDDRLCVSCAKYQNRLWRAVWQWIPRRVHRRWERISNGI